MCDLNDFWTGRHLFCDDYKEYFRNLKWKHKILNYFVNNNINKNNVVRLTDDLYTSRVKYTTRLCRRISVVNG